MKNREKLNEAFSGINGRFIEKAQNPPSREVVLNDKQKEPNASEKRK
ncbi:MAG: hypothetical protein IJU52_01235 [Clostridia bacterium]|nr:hypothetical protein [Clostridia bacterium]